MTKVGASDFGKMKSEFGFDLFFKKDPKLPFGVLNLTGHQHKTMKKSIYDFFS